MPFVSCSVLRWGDSLALAPKKSVALQARRRPSPDVALVLSGSGAKVTTSLAGEALLMVAPVPSVEQAGARAKGTPLEVTEQTMMEAIPLPTLEWMGQMELPLTLVAPAAVGVMPLVEAPPT